jgi:hypothetical protein
VRAPIQDAYSNYRTVLTSATAAEVRLQATILLPMAALRVQQIWLLLQPAYNACDSAKHLCSASINWHWQATANDMNDQSAGFKR